ncbi:MAG TPA: polysaccharide biosynthesis/export family protein [Acidisarcina sp.]|nr:polysaccharide biosynthesis/export family protein [Acidisarcina sp.]
MHDPDFSYHRLIVCMGVGGAILLGITFAQSSQATAQSSPVPAKTATGMQEGRGAATPRPQSLAAIPDDFSSLKLAPGFLLSVDVYGEPELSGRVRVDNDGNISFPFLGVLHVAGDTMPEAQKKLQQRFRDQEILTNPQVTLNIEQFAATGVTVLGEVQSPGRIELLAPHTLLDVIGMAGGETQTAGKVVEVKHADVAAGQPPTNIYEYSRGSNGDSIRDVMVRPGDTVMVKRAGVVYVLGAVNRPGGYVMQEDGELDVAQAISLAQGLSMQAKTSGLRVVKRLPDGQLKEVPVSYKHMMEGKATPIKLEAEDIVYVPVSKVKAMLTGGASIIGQATSATIYAVR